MSTKSEKPVCQYCGSDDVYVDAYAAWNNETQEWELVNTFDNYVCNGECDGSETSVEWVNGESK